MIQNQPSLIEYSAFFGSIQIFQYLFINNVAIEEQKLSLYSIHSNRADMIHLFESYGILKTEEIIEGYFLESIKCHHKQISEYIANNLIKRTIDIEKEENDQRTFHLQEENRIKLEMIQKQNEVDKHDDHCGKRCRRYFGYRIVFLLYLGTYFRGKLGASRGDLRPGGRYVQSEDFGL